MIEDRIREIKAQIQAIDSERESEKKDTDLNGELQRSINNIRELTKDDVKNNNEQKNLIRFIEESIKELSGINDQARIFSFSREKIAVLDKIIESNKNMNWFMKEKIDLFLSLTEDDKTYIFLNKILRHFFPELIPKSPQWLKRKAEEQANDVFLVPEASESEKEDLIGGIKAEYDEKTKEVDRISKLLNSYSDKKSLENASLELVKSLKNYPELKKRYEEMISELHAGAQVKDRLSSETEILAKLKEFLQDKNIYPF